MISTGFWLFGRQTTHGLIKTFSLKYTLLCLGTGFQSFILEKAFFFLSLFLFILIDIQLKSILHRNLKIKI